MVPSADAPSAHICEVLTIYYKVRENVKKNQGVINSVKVRKCRNVQSSFFSQNPYLKTIQCWHHCVMPISWILSRSCRLQCSLTMHCTVARASLMRFFVSMNRQMLTHVVYRIQLR